MPDGFDAWFYMAQALEEVGRTGEALAAYEKASGLDRTRAAYRFGLILARVGREEGALGHLEVAARANPDDPWPKAQLANLYRSLGRVSEATPLLEAVVSAHPHEPAFHLYLAESLLVAGDLDRAWKEFEAALDASPGLVDAMRGKAGVLGEWARRALEDGKLGEARSLLERARVLSPDDPEILRGLGLVKARQGDYRGALDLFARVGSGIHTRVATAETLILGARADEAGDILEALGQGDDIPYLEHTRAMWLVAEGRAGEAMELLKGLGGPEVVARNLLRVQVLRARELAKAGKARASRRLLEEAMAGLRKGSGAGGGDMIVTLAAVMAEQRDYGAALGLLKKHSLVDRAARLAAYCLYKLKKYDRAWKVLMAAGRTRGRLGAAVAHRLAQGAILRRDASSAAKWLDRARAALGRDTEALSHDRALVDMLQGRVREAVATLEGLVSGGKVPEATLNLASWYDRRGDDRRAYELYRAYLAHPGEHAGLVRKIVKAKERVFGFGGGRR